MLHQGVFSFSTELPGFLSRHSHESQHTVGTVEGTTIKAMALGGEKKQMLFLHLHYSSALGTVTTWTRDFSPALILLLPYPHLLLWKTVMQVQHSLTLTLVSVCEFSYTRDTIINHTQSTLIDSARAVCCSPGPTNQHLNKVSLLSMPCCNKKSCCASQAGHLASCARRMTKRYTCRH